MADQQAGRTDAKSVAGGLRRRGVVAGLAALVAGLLTKATARVVEATDSTALMVGQTNSATQTTTLDRNSTDQNRAGLVVLNNTFDAIQGVASGALSYGVLGDSASGNGFGVVGTSSSGVDLSGGAGSGVGVAGDANSGTAIFGTSDTGTAIQGISTGTGNQSGVYGVYGEVNANPNQNLTAAAR